MQVPQIVQYAQLVIVALIPVLFHKFVFQEHTVSRVRQIVLIVQLAIIVQVVMRPL